MWPKIIITVATVSICSFIVNIDLIAAIWEKIIPREFPMENQNLYNSVFSSNNRGQLNTLDSSCMGMFDIGFNYKDQRQSKFNYGNIFGEGYSTREWNQLLREKEHATQSNEDYLPLLKSIAKLATPFQGQLKLNNKTRLQIMEGRIPYIPCAIRNYNEEELTQCFNARSKQSKKSWIVFMGDSRMRNLFHYIVYRTQGLMKWSLYKVKGKATLFRHTVDLHEYLTWVNATSSTGNMLSYVGAVYGLKNIHPPHPIEFLHRLLQLPEKLPTILIINFGSWEYSEMYKVKFGLFIPHSEIILVWNKMIKILQKLSFHMTIICVSLPSPGEVAHEVVEDMNLKKRMFTFKQIIKESTQFVGFAMRAFLKNSNVIFWDSTVPFNLAARKECVDLVQYERPLIAAELKKDWSFQRFMCHDEVHKSRSTLHDEATILFNLVCNKFMAKNKDHSCCS